MTYTVDTTFKMSNTINICERTNSNGLRVVAVKKMNEYMATDENGELVTVVKVERQWLPVQGNIYMSYVIAE